MTTNSANTAGIMALCAATELNLINSNVEGCEIKSLTEANSNFSNSSTAGIIGTIAGGNNFTSTIDDCDFSDSSIDARGRAIGGILATSVNTTGTTIEIKNCDVTKCIITDENMQPYQLGIGRGGISGIINGVSIYDNCTVKDTEIKTISGSLGGITGMISKNSEINNCTIDNVDLVHNNTVKLINNNDSGYSKIYNNYMSIGGIIGISSALTGEKVASTIEINNPTITELDITVEAGEEDRIHTGGIVGFAQNATINNANIGKEEGNIVGVNIDNQTPNGIVGGICAIVSNVLAVSNSTDAEVTISDTNVRNSTLKGLNHVGGFIGFSTIAEITGSSINKTTITSAGDTGIVGEFAGVISNNDVELGKSATRTSKIKIIDSTTSEVEVSGTTHNSEKLVGSGTVEK